MQTLWQDIRYALRMLGKNPGFSTVAILTIALGVGANTAVFGLIESAFLQDMPFHEPGRLVHIWSLEADGDVHTPTPAQYQAVRNNSKSYEQIAVVGWTDYFYEDNAGVSQTLPGFMVSPTWLPTLGVQPLLGRNFREEEQIAGRGSVVLLSYDCWRKRFHGDSHIIDKQVVLNRRPVRIVGVLPRSLAPYYGGVEIFAPLVLDSYLKEADLRAGKIRVQIIARLKPGITLQQAGSEAEVIAAQVPNTSAPTNRADRLVVEDFAETFRHAQPTIQNARRGLGLTAVAAGVVLLIACANVASFLLARGVKRQREIAVRSALGCSRSRMVRQLLTESTLLFLCGIAVALLVTGWCEDIITNVASGLVPGAYLHVNTRVFLTALGVSLVSAVAFGLVPALRVTGVNLSDNLKNAAAKFAGSSQSRRLRNALVASQVALGMALLVGFGLLMRSLLNVESSPLGYDPRNVLTASIRLPAMRYTTPADRIRLMRQAVERLHSMPEVESAGIADSLPMNGADSARVRVESPDAKSAPIEDEIWFVSVGPAYFSTLRVPVLAGRAFQEGDDQTGVRTAIVNQIFAKRYFPDTNPIGHRLAFADSPTDWIEIVGVVSDFRQRNPEEDLRPLAYFPITQTVPARWSVAVRLRGDDTAAISSRVSKGLERLDPQLSWEMGSLPRLIADSESLTMRRPIITLVASFGSLALLLVIVGVFGVTSYSVAERTQEIGIRVALGAAHSEIAGLVLRESLLVAGAGIVVGAFCALLLTRLLPTEGIGWSGSGIFLYGVSRTDSVTYFSAVALLMMIAFAASWIPARRATRVDPMVALRYE